MKVFISYSHKDNDWFDEDSKFSLVPFLKRYFKARIDFWFDPELSKNHTGERYKEIIEKQINESEFAILLLSNEFVSSSFIEEVEIPLIRELFDLKKIQIIPILVGPVDLSKHEAFEWLQELQILPSNNTPLIIYTSDKVKWELIKGEIVNSLGNRFFPKKTEKVDSSKNPDKEVVDKDESNRQGKIINNSQIRDKDYNNKISDGKKTSGWTESLIIFLKEHKKFLFIIIASILLALVIILTYKFIPTNKTLEFSGVSNDSLSIIVETQPPFNWAPQSEDMYKISGRIKGLKDYRNYRIVVYANTIQYYIQPGLDNPLTIIDKDGKWQLLTRLGGEYVILLVNDNYKPSATLDLCPEKGGEIIDVFILSNNVLTNNSSAILVEIKPPFIWKPKTDAMYQISGKIEGIKDYQNYCIVVYAHTNFYYIQPGLDEPLTYIDNDGKWKLHTRLGGEYVILLVNKNYKPAAQLNSCPHKGGDIIDIFVLNK
jgi:hypothetical protein